MVEADQIQLATQLGRLDFLSAVLACLAIILAVAGIFGFIHFRGVARNTARDTAREETQKIAESAAVQYLQERLPQMMEDYRELAENAVTAEQADDIAQAQDDNEAGHEGDK